MPPPERARGDGARDESLPLSTSAPPLKLDAALLEENVEDLYEHAPCGYVSTLSDGTIAKVNETFLRWTGYSREELVGTMRLQSLLPVGARILWETHLAPLLRMQSFVKEIALDIVCKGGRTIPVLTNTTQRKDDSGQPLFNRMMLLDASERREYERELVSARNKAEQAARAKADFLSMMSHEIRTPLNAIVGVSHLLERTIANAQQERYIRILKSSSEGLLALINDVLDFSRIEAGKVGIDKKVFSLPVLVHDLAFGFSVQAESKSIGLTVDVDEALPPALLGDATKIGQVLRNLVGNAVKFTERGEVVISVRVIERAADNVRLAFSVRDTGVGIPADRLSTIFEEFTQASPDVATRFGGSGLGLAISRRLLELHGSRMTVESVVGVGSTFAFELTLPVAQPSPEVAQHEELTRAVRGLRILVADDNHVNVFVLASFLKRWGVDFDIVENGRHAVERVLERDYDLVLMDLQMPDLNGYEATQTIRRLGGERFKTLPIIAISASTRPDEDHGIGRNDGFDGFIGKPFAPEQLLTTIAGCLRKKRTLPTRVLVVDDHEDAAELLAESLRLSGYETAVATDDVRALEAAATFRPDVVLLDLNLGGVSGYDVAERMRALPNMHAAQLVALTGHADDEAKARSRDASFVDHVVKPISVADLVTVLSRIDKRRR